MKVKENSKLKRLKEILAAENEMFIKVWYGRYQETRTGRRQGNIWEQAKKTAAKAEEAYGLENLGHWDDYEWGMLNGKLSALRWVLGDEWDNLDA